MSEQPANIEEIFLNAIEMADESARGTYLEKACHGDQALRDRIDKLLRAVPHVGAFMEVPVYIPDVEAKTRDVSEAVELTGHTIGPYTLLQKIGEGGMGTVYLAQQDEPVKRRVALKIIRTGMDTAQFIARFEHERQALALMDHPNIARVIDAGAAANGQPYFAMELVQGVPITTFCDQEHLSINERIQLLIPVCLAVQHAHQKGIVHRDIKPSNVIVAIYDGRPVPKVIDFGVAKATAKQVTERTMFTELGQMIGTLEYMAPEQAETNNPDVDTRADIYSLGVLLYELLTGAPPFSANDLRAAGLAGMLRMVTENEPSKPSTKITGSEDLPRIAANRRLEPRRLANLVRGELDWISMKCLEKDRTRRYETANGLASDLQRYLANEPVEACPPTARYRLGKVVHKYRVGLAAAAGFVVFLSMASIISVNQAFRAADAEHRAVVGWKEAETERDRARDVNQFMNEILTSVEPDEKGADVHLVDVLEEAASGVSRRFADNPLQEADVRIMLGQIFSRLDFGKRAIAEFEQASNLYMSQLEATDRRVLNARFQHARELMNQGSTRPANRILKDLVPQMLSVLDLNDLLLMAAQGLQASGLGRIGRYQEAETTLRALRTHAASIEESDVFQIKLLDQLINLQKMQLTNSPHERAARLPDLKILAEEMVERSQRALGPTSVETLRSRVLLADIIYRCGKFQAAADICQQVLDSSADRLGKKHVQRLLAMDLLAKTKHRLGDSRTAAECFLQRLELTDDNVNPITRLVIIGEALPILDRGGLWADGERLAREFSATLANLGGGHGNMQFISDLYVARFVSLQGRLEEAESLFKSLQSRVAENANDPLILARSHLYYGSHLRLQKLFDAAEKEIQTAADTVPDIRHGTSNHNPDDIIVEFIALYDDWDKPEKADSFRDQLKEVLEAAKNTD